MLEEVAAHAAVWKDQRIGARGRLRMLLHILYFLEQFASVDPSILNFEVLAIQIHDCKAMIPTVQWHIGRMEIAEGSR